MDPPVRRRHRDLLGNRPGPRRRIEGATHPSAVPPANRTLGSKLPEATWADWTQGQSRPDGPAFGDPVGFRRTRQMTRPTDAATGRKCRKTPAQRQRAGVRRVSMSRGQSPRSRGSRPRERTKPPTGESGVFVLSTSCLQAIRAAGRRPAAQSVAQRAIPSTTRGSRLHASHEEPVESGVRPLRSEPAPPCVGLWKTRGKRAIFRHTSKNPAAGHASRTRARPKADHDGLDRSRARQEGRSDRTYRFLGPASGNASSTSRYCRIESSARNARNSSTEESAPRTTNEWRPSASRISISERC